MVDNTELTDDQIDINGIIAVPHPFHSSTIAVSSTNPNLTHTYLQLTPGMFPKLPDWQGGPSDSMYVLCVNSIICTVEEINKIIAHDEFIANKIGKEYKTNKFRVLKLCPSYYESYKLPTGEGKPEI